MKISSINNFNPAFGYNKKLNKELKQKLNSNPNQLWANRLLQMNELCNGLEDDIRAEEKTLKDDEKYPSLMEDKIDVLASTKAILALYVSFEHEDLNYADREFSHYKSQIEKRGYKDNDWRRKLCSALQDWTSKKSDIDDFYNKHNGINTQVKEDEKEANAEPNDDAVYDTDAAINNLIFPLNSAASGADKNANKLLEIYSPKPNSPKGFSDVAGMTKLKEELTDGIISYIEDPKQAQIDFEEYGKTMPKSILLYGPPGCGKTYITQALSQQVQSPLYLLNLSKAGSHYVNMTSKNIKEAFTQVADIAQQQDKPVMLFMDEIDSLAFDRSSRTENEDLKQVATLLQELDNVKNSNVIVIGATNKFNLIDPAIRRRFDMKVLVDVPDLDARKELLAMNLSSYKKGHSLAQSDEELTRIAEMTEGYSNSSITAISKAAALNAMKRGRADIALRDYQKAIEETTEEKPKREEYLPDSKKSKKIGFN